MISPLLVVVAIFFAGPLSHYKSGLNSREKRRKKWERERVWEWYETKVPSWIWSKVLLFPNVSYCYQLERVSGREIEAGRQTGSKAKHCCKSTVAHSRQTEQTAVKYKLNWWQDEIHLKKLGWGEWGDETGKELTGWRNWWQSRANHAGQVWQKGAERC